MDIERKSDGIHQERMGSPEAAVIYFDSITYHIKKYIANQSLSITAIFVSSCIGKERCVTRQNSCMGDQLPASSADYRDVTEGPSPPPPTTKELEKHCVTKQRTAAQK